MANFTRDDLAEFSKEEAHILNDIFNIEDELEMQDELLSPSQGSVNNVLAYSKALSVRKTKKIDKISFILN